MQEIGAGSGNIQKLRLRMGFPDSFLAMSGAMSLTWRQAFVATYLESDLPQLGFRIPAPQMRRFWSMVAHCHCQLWNATLLQTTS